MNEYDLFDAFGGIDEDLLKRSETCKITRRIPFRKALIAAAAVMVMAATVVAAPAIRELLFPSAPVQTTVGKRHFYGDLYTDIQNDKYRIDLKIDSAAPLPTKIEEVRLPHYMIDDHWLVSYGEVDAVNSEGPVHFKWWDRESPKWVSFEQMPIPSGEITFHLETYHGAELRQETVQIGDLELQYLNIPGYTNRESWEFYPEATAVYWSDGEYAYHLECSSDVTEKELAQIVRSVGLVEDVTPYLKNDPNNDGRLLEYPPLDVYKKPAFLPDGYALKVCVRDDWHVTWFWENAEGSTIHFTSGHSHIVTELYTAESYKDHPGYAHEELQVDDLTVHFIRYSGCLWLIWDDGDFCEAANVNIPLHHVYSLRWEGTDTEALDDILAIMESVEDVEDITQYLTS